MKSKLLIGSMLMMVLAFAPVASADPATDTLPYDATTCSVTPPGAFIDCYPPYLISWSKGRVTWVCDQIGWSCPEMELQ